jgi:hypothetical protein
MSFVDYIKRGWNVVQLKADTVKELSADEHAVGPAIGILAIGGVCAGIGSLNFVGVVVSPFIFVVFGFVFVAIMHFIATTFFGGEGKLMGLMVPVFCGALVTWVAVVPLLGPLFLIHLAFLWMLVVMVVCVENVYGIDRGKAIGVVAIPVVLSFIIGGIIFAMGLTLIAATGALSS